MEALKEKNYSKSSSMGLGKRLFFSPVPVQTKLQVNLPGDKYEVEADQVADQIVQRLPESDLFAASINQNLKPNNQGKPVHQFGKSISTIPAHYTYPIQSKCEACEEEKGILRKSESQNTLKPFGKEIPGVSKGKIKQKNNELPTVSAETEARLFSSKAGGNPLPKKTQSEMEQGFGVDFSNVRIHTDPSAVGMNKKLGALAFTHGSDIYFNSGKFDAQSKVGKKLLAHELTHVVQQRKSPNTKIQRAIGDGHDLSSPRFAGDIELEEVYDGNKVLERGERGGHVNKIQHAIQDKGFFLIHHGIDGIFEGETQGGVRNYQQHKGISADPIGKVGSHTMAALDADFPTVSDNSSTLSQNPADVSCIQELLCPWNEAIINDFRGGARRVIFVDDLFWADEIFQGGSWQPHPMPGAGETSGNTIRLNISNDCETVARTLYHEYQHARSPRRLRTEPWADEEDYAYTLETNWSIARGLSPDPGLVTTDPVSGETVIDQASLDAHVATYPGMGSNEEVIAKVGANRVRVRRDNGTVYVRNAAEGETVPGPRQVVNPQNIRPIDWPSCP